MYCWWNHRLLVINSTFSPSEGRSKDGAESPLATSPYQDTTYPGAQEKSTLLAQTACVVERVLFWITKDTPITQEIPRVLEVLCQEPGTETKICISYYITEIPDFWHEPAWSWPLQPTANCSPNSGDTQILLCPHAMGSKPPAPCKAPTVQITPRNLGSLLMTL